jgi:acetolactate synthase-1/2/3 large subunit
LAHVGDLLAELLVRYGVTHVFGQPGGQTVALYDGLARRSQHVTHVLVRDERSAAYAADAFARITGRPGVCDVTVGPGTTKLADGLVESRNASVPVLALVGELPRDWEPYREMGVASQGFDQVSFLRTITKATLPVPSPEALPQLVRTGFRLMTTGRPGPVALALPHDVLDAEWTPNGSALEIDERYAAAPAFRPVADPESVRAAAGLLARSLRPVIVAGGGVHDSRATAEFQALAEILDAVVVTSLTGKGAVSELAPYAAGVLNPLGTQESVELVRRADVVFWCGTKVGQNTSLNWTLPAVEQATIHLDCDGAELGRTFRPSVALNGDARSTLQALLTLLDKQTREDWLREAADAKVRGESERAARAARASTPLAPERVMSELDRRLGEDDVVVSDASFAAGWVAAHLPARKAGRHFVFARGQGGLGYAVPAALGASAASGAGRIVTVSGDGGFGYGLGELSTQAQQHMPVVNVVLNNGTLGWLDMWQKLYFDGLHLSVDLGEVQDFASVARGLGCDGFRVDHHDQLGDALEAAFASDRPSVVDVRTDPGSTPVHSFRRRLAEGLSYPRPGTVYELVAWRRSPGLARP